MNGGGGPIDVLLRRLLAVPIVDVLTLALARDRRSST